MGADELANQYLFEGLHFSKWDSLLEILERKYSDIINSKDYKIIATQIFACNSDLFPDCVDDDYSYTAEYDELCEDIYEYLKDKFVVNEYGIHIYNSYIVASIHDMFPGKYFSKFYTVKNLLKKNFTVCDDDYTRFTKQILFICDHYFPLSIGNHEEYLLSDEYQELCDFLNDFIVTNVEMYRNEEASLHFTRDFSRFYLFKNIINEEYGLSSVSYTELKRAFTEIEPVLFPQYVPQPTIYNLKSEEYKNIYNNIRDLILKNVIFKYNDIQLRKDFSG